MAWGGVAGDDAGLTPSCSVLRFEDLPVTSLLRRDGIFSAGATHGGVSAGQEALPGGVSTPFRAFLHTWRLGLFGAVSLSWVCGIV